MKKKTLCPDCRKANLKSIAQPDGSMVVKCENECGCMKHIPAKEINIMKQQVQRYFVYQLN